MAKPRILTSLEDVLSSLNDRIRQLELNQGRFGNWQLVEDQGTGQLLAVRDNGQDVAKTIVILANP